MRFALWGGLFGALVAAGFQIQTYEMLHARWIVTTAIGSAIVSLLIGRPLVDWFKSLFHRPPARFQ
jgi:hypothetical protein